MRCVCLSSAVFPFFADCVYFLGDGDFATSDVGGIYYFLRRRQIRCTDHEVKESMEGRLQVLAFAACCDEKTFSFSRLFVHI